MARQGIYVRQPQGYKSFVPTPLPPKPPLNLNPEIMKKNEQATLSLAKLDGLAYSLPNLNLFIAMYVRKEALLSSQIEGSQASLEDIFEYESGMEVDDVNDVEEVINYIKAMDYGVERLETLPMSLRLIKEIHRILLSGARGSNKTPGEFKRSQNWIGSSKSTIKTALFVPPAPKDTLKGMSDFENYLHLNSPYPEIINCGLLHYQFETIHPFLDGNGRVGRLLITLYLYWKGIIEKPILYVSYYFKKHRTAYYDHLTLVRKTGDYEKWTLFFLDGIIEASNSAIESTKQILLLQNKDTELLWQKNISSPLAVKLLNTLFYTPIISINGIAKQFDVSYPTAAQVVNQFVDAGILKEITGQKRLKRFVYTEYMDILSEGTE